MLTLLILLNLAAVGLLALGWFCLRIAALSDARAEALRRRELGSMPAVWLLKRNSDDEAA